MVNQLIQCALDAVYKELYPTFLGAFSMLLSNFKNFIARCKVKTPCLFTSQKWCSYEC